YYNKQRLKNLVKIFCNNANLFWEFRLMYLHNKNNMRHFCITNKKKQKTSIFIFGQWVFWPIVVIVLLVIIFILPAYWSVINFDQL
ncbi:hypothetical protein Q7I60_05450, partial [Escherichia coli]|uniref:hypothetical protein n=1 Tax=Escherichia coli TaxID=562 RepID=UPI003EE56022